MTELILDFEDTPAGQTALRVILDGLVKKVPPGMHGFRMNYATVQQRAPRAKQSARGLGRELIVKEFGKVKVFSRKDVTELGLANGFNVGSIGGVLDRMVAKKILVRVGGLKSGKIAWKGKPV